MAKTYSELEAWAIFIGALIMGVVLTSLFWALITVPEDVKKIEKEIKNATEEVGMEKPEDFITFCKKVDGIANWDNMGFRQCIVKDSEKNLIVMNLLCRKFNLTLSYGSFGVKCEGTI
ncbi:hypothetical protein J4480_01675 [Candidatus Woesearchaeota archaeon]|nr:hypothetical protein [Candidatus Woesearchaeota archaeon]HLC60879.1 hypothetical protein [Candidatus Nanoarchaeia archaeon]